MSLFVCAVWLCGVSDVVAGLGVLVFVECGCVERFLCIGMRRIRHSVNVIG
jgi:hypothetical protein